MTKLTWEDIEKMTDELAVKIKASGFKPDYIIGLTTGGLIPLYFMVRKLENNHKFLTIAANSYNKDEKEELKISYLPEIDLSGKNVLLIDEIVGTGDTLKEVSKVIDHANSKGLKIKQERSQGVKFNYGDFIMAIQDMRGNLNDRQH